MIGKALLSGLWVCPECRSLAVFFTLDHVSLSSFTAVVRLTTFVATRRCRCLLQSVRVNVMPWRLLFVISGILAGGIPGFCIELCCFPHPLLLAPVFFVAFLVVCLLCRACVIMAHKMSLCMYRDDTKLSPLALIDLFHPLTGTCHVTAQWCVWFFWFVLCLVLCVCVLFVLGAVFGFCFLGSWCFVWFSCHVLVHMCSYFGPGNFSIWSVAIFASSFPWSVWLFHGHSTSPCVASWSCGLLLPGHSTSWSFCVTLAFVFLFGGAVYPQLTHIPGRLNVLADELSRFKEPLSVAIDPRSQKSIPWIQLLQSSGIEITQTGRKWPSYFDIHLREKGRLQSADWVLPSIVFWGVLTPAGRWSIGLVLLELPTSTGWPQHTPVLGLLTGVSIGPAGSNTFCTDWTIFAPRLKQKAPAQLPWYTCLECHAHNSALGKLKQRKL